MSAPHLKAYIGQLGDFDDVEAERAALTQVERHGNVHAALAFLINCPALDRAARVVDIRIEEIDGDLDELLDPAATALEAPSGSGSASPAPDRFHAAEGPLHALPPCRAACAGDRESAVRHRRLRTAREPCRLHGAPRARACAQSGVLDVARGMRWAVRLRNAIPSASPSQCS